MKKVRKNVQFPEENIKKFSEKAERMGMDANGLLNLLVAGVIGNEEYQTSLQVIAQVAPIGQQKNTP